ncbi:MAG: hypothetical protein JRH20_29085 [Deltaproteobacteria bacterium]|nr:hypothetical protein [Deltaproteobacteria bacterium]
MLVRHLSEWWEVEEAPNGEDALKKFRAFCPHIVLSDWVMPGLHGEDPQASPKDRA